MSDPFQSVTIVNRRAIPYEAMFSGICIVFQPHEKKSYPPNVAFAILIDSTLRTNLASGVKEVFALGIEGDSAYPTDPIEGDLAFKDPVEQLDRRDVQRLTETEPKSLGATGSKGLGVGKVEKTTTPLPGASQESPFVGEGSVGGSAPGGGLPQSSEEEVVPVTFKNPDIQKGPSRHGKAEHRVSNKPI